MRLMWDEMWKFCEQQTPAVSLPGLAPALGKPPQSVHCAPIASEWVECPICRGSGYLLTTFSGDNRCPACHASGQVSPDVAPYLERRRSPARPALFPPAKLRGRAR